MNQAHSHMHELIARSSQQSMSMSMARADECCYCDDDTDDGVCNDVYDCNRPRRKWSHRIVVYAFVTYS